MSPPGSREFDVVIIGAGVIGTVMASLLVARKLTVPGRVAIVADRLAGAVPPGADWDLKVFALSRASQRLLEACSVWEKLPAARKFAYQRMCVWDAAGEAGGRGSLEFDCAELGEPNLGFIVDGRHLQWQCLQAARASGAVLIEAGLESIGAGDAAMTTRLKDGRALSSQLTIAADGQESKTRALLGIETAGHAYHQDALVAHVRTARPHGNTAWQRFLPGGPLAFLPLADGRSSIVWSVPREEAAHLGKLDDAAFAAALTAASGGVLGDVALSSGRAAYPLKLQYASQYARPRAVLLGDAAHAVHPLAGLGLNLGLLDCAALAEVFEDARGADDFGEYRILRRYERRRRSENLLAAAALDGLERLFSNARPLSTALRAAGLAAVGRLPMVKRDLAQRALGLTGDVAGFLKADRAWPHK
jgi:ubiquinone biosynthesis UbiH/UbiF/VisC/COQ6 family hydroxylase